TSSGDPTAREPVRFGRRQPWGTETPSASPEFEGWANLNVFPSRAALPSLQRSPPLRAWRLPGEAARAAPPQRPPSRGRGSLLARIRARRRAVPRPHDVLGPASSQARDLAGPPRTKADEARLLGGGGGGPHRC